MNAIILLERDHAKVKGLMARLDATTARATVTRRDLLDRIRAELTVHETIEEEIFYPALKAHPRAKDVVLEGIEEHNVVDNLLGELTAMPPSHESWGAKATVMRENVEHHIEEEETDMFVKARSIFRPCRARGARRADGGTQGHGQGVRPDDCRQARAMTS